MRELRRVLICRMPLGIAGTTYDPDHMSTVKAEVLTEIARDIPRLLQATTAEPVVQFEAIGDRFHASVSLQELPQYSFRFVSGSGSSGGWEDDLFLQDVQVAIEQRDQAPGLIYASAGPIDPEMILPGGSGIRAASIRAGVIKRRKLYGEVIAPGLPNAVPVPVNDVPRILPDGFRMVVTCNVIEISRDRAKLSELRLHPIEQDDIVQMPSLPVRMNLLRLGIHRLPETGSILQRAMDRRLPLVLRVLLARNWIDGRASHLELIDVLGDRA